MDYDFSLSPVGIAIMGLTKMYNENYATINHIGVLWASDTESPALLPIASSVINGPSESGGRMILHVEVLDPDMPTRDFPLRWFRLPEPSVNGAIGGAVFFRPSTKYASIEKRKAEQSSNPPVRSSGRARKPSSKVVEMQGIPEEILSDEDDNVCVNALETNRIRVDLVNESQHRKIHKGDARINSTKVRRTSTPYPSPDATPLKKRATSPIDVISLHDSDSEPETTRKRRNAFVDDEADESEQANSDIEEDLDRYESDFIDEYVHIYTNTPSPSSSLQRSYVDAFNLSTIF
ncbi:hypothetical protein CC2G_014266 [Coprinopsis cinerea AmutBmut pab1-1]|nr:hypothetical protein CC2G_014266 [Coprinopsis cinerea AmutBmut pab1-1]